MANKQSAAQLKAELESRLSKLITICVPRADAKTRRETVAGLMKMVDEKVSATNVVGNGKPPMCEECDEEMHEFAGAEGTDWVEGFACDQCGWSFDTYRGKQ